MLYKKETLSLWKQILVIYGRVYTNETNSLMGWITSLGIFLSFIYTFSFPKLRGRKEHRQTTPKTQSGVPAFGLRKPLSSQIVFGTIIENRKQHL